MTESGNGAPQSEATFESLEKELLALLQGLEDPAVPLEERLRLHARAVSMHGRLEAVLEAARKATGEAGKRDGPRDEPAAETDREPYEAVRDRLAQVVNALEGGGLPLARVVELHGEAQRLATRCEAILDGAQREITRAGGTEPAAASDAGGRRPAAEDGQDDAPR